MSRLATSYASTEPAVAQPVVSAGMRWRWLGILKDAAFFLYLHCGYVAVRDAILSLCGRSRVVVVYYHRIGQRDVLSKPTAEFRGEMEYLKRHYQCITLGDLCDRLRSAAPLRRRCAVVTFDDGYRDNYTEALPVLLATGVPATFFIATGFVGSPRDFPHDSRRRQSDRQWQDYPKLTWEDCRRMQDAGFEVGSHTVNHANLGRADGATIHQEVSDSLAAIQERLGLRPRAFSFPWGQPQDVSRCAIEAARDAGYYAALWTCGGAVGRGTDPFHLRRVDLGNGQLSRLAARAKLAGLDPDYLRTWWRQRLSRLKSFRRFA